MKRKSFFKENVIKNNMFIKQKRVQSSCNLFLKKCTYTVDEKKLILQKFFLLCIVSCRSISSYPSPSPSISLTDFLHVAIYYSWPGQSSILSLSNTSCIMHCIIFHIIFHGFLNKEAPTFKSINNINKCIKYPFPITLKFKIKNNSLKKENGVGALFQIKSHNTLLTLKSKAEGHPLAYF